jgi:hypothetical protein
MRFYFFILLFLFLAQTLFSQSKIEDDIEYALANAKKGVYWALSNIPVKKSKIDKSIISEDKLLAKVKIAKELNGVRVESTGYNQTNEVTIVIYRSKDSLIKDGYIKKGDLETYSEDE